jgi:hypothetical protein
MFYKSRYDGSIHIRKMVADGMKLPSNIHILEYLQDVSHLSTNSCEVVSYNYLIRIIYWNNAKHYHAIGF